MKRFLTPGFAVQVAGAWLICVLLPLAMVIVTTVGILVAHEVVTGTYRIILSAHSEGAT